MKKNYYYFCILFLICSLSLQAYNLQVQDPKQTSRYAKGSIDSAELTIKPLGAYFEYGLYLTLSSKGSSYTKSTDTLEIQFFFNLDQNAMMIDSWLWVDDTIVKAMLIDKGQAKQIYEDIVKRRRDPSILYKNTQTSYEYRIFPLAGSSFRKVKISWLQPANWSEKSVSAILPTFLLQESKNPVSKLRVIALTDSVWTNPGLSSAGYKFDEIVDPVYGRCQETYLANKDFSNQPMITFSSPLKNGCYLRCYADNQDEGYYQLIMMSRPIINISPPKKTLFIVDYDISMSDLNKTDILLELKNSILTNYAAKDSFNILLSNSTDYYVSDKWECAEATHVEEIFTKIDDSHLSFYPYLQLSLPSGIKYIKEHGKDANIIIISCSDGLGNYKIANPLIDEIHALVDFKLQINCIDYSIYSNRRSILQNNIYYVGNYYLYDYLTKWTGGYYLDAYKPIVSLSTAISSIIVSSEGTIQSLEIYSTLDSGFCYGRYDMVFSQSQKDAGIAFQVGRYYGRLPFILRATGFYRNQPFSKEVSLDAVPENDPMRMVKRVWSGNYIKKLETGTVNNDIIKEIIDVSRMNRVQSLYTAFLALEPWRMPQNEDYIFYSSEEEEVTTRVDELAAIGNEFIKIKAFPNPFTKSLQIEVSDLMPDVEIQAVEIYNSYGSLVKMFGRELLTGNNIKWLGDDNTGAEAPAGFYLILVKTNKGILSLKVALIR